MSGHTSEPWKLGYSARSSPVGTQSLTIRAKAGWGNEKFPTLEQTIARAHWVAYTSIHECEANARRIVACVNACAGIEINTLEGLTPGYIEAALKKYSWCCE